MEEPRIRTIVDIELPPVLESVAYARDLVSASVPTAARRRAAAVVSELVQHAVKHGIGPIALRVDTDVAAVHVIVRDAHDLQLVDDIELATSEAVTG